MLIGNLLLACDASRSEGHIDVHLLNLDRESGRQVRISLVSETPPTPRAIPWKPFRQILFHFPASNQEFIKLRSGIRDRMTSLCRKV